MLSATSVTPTYCAAKTEWKKAWRRKLGHPMEKESLEKKAWTPKESLEGKAWTPDYLFLFLGTFHVSLIGNV